MTPTPAGTAAITHRLDVAQQRLETHAAGPTPTSLTEPDPDTPEERWDAGQVWAHMAEFVPYWLAELDKVVKAYTGTPVPFGRTKSDPLRIAAVEANRGVPVPELMARVSQAIVGWRQYLAALPPDYWRSVGLHSTRGEMDVAQMVNRFLLNHLEEHIEQLDLLT